MSVWKKFLNLFKKENSIESKVVPRDDYDYMEKRSKITDELNRILDKINGKGIESLSNKEKEFLEKQSKK